MLAESEIKAFLALEALHFWSKTIKMSCGIRKVKESFFVKISNIILLIHVWWFSRKKEISSKVDLQNMKIWGAKAEKMFCLFFGKNWCLQETKKPTNFFLTVQSYIQTKVNFIIVLTSMNHASVSWFLCYKALKT